MDLGQITDQREGVRVTEGYDDHSVVNKGRQGGVEGGFLTSSGSTGALEDPNKFTHEATLLPKTSGGVPEAL